MHTVTALDLAYGIRFALERGHFMPTDYQRLQHLLTRWDHQQRTPNPGAAIVRQWATDPECFLKTFAQLDEVQRYQMAEAAVAYHRQCDPQSELTVEQQLETWKRRAVAVGAQQCAETGGNRGHSHGSSTTMRA